MARHGSFWMGTFSLLARAAALAASLILARLIGPAQFGLVGVALVVAGALAIFGELGLGASVIQSQFGALEVYSASVVLLPLLGVAAYTASYFLAPLLSYALGQPHAAGVVRVLTLSILWSSFGVVPTALLEKDLRYKAKALANGAGALCYLCASVSLAYAYHDGAYAVALGLNVQAAVSAGIAWWVYGAPARPRFHREILKQLLKYSKNIALGSVIAYLTTNMDNAFVSRRLGRTSLGLYLLAYGLANAPGINIADVVGRVTLPVFVRIKAENSRLAYAYTSSAAVVGLIAFPLLVLLATYPRFLIAVSLGSRWEGMAPVLRVLTVFGAGRVLSGVTSGLFLATGHTEFLYRTGALGLGLQAVGLWVALVLLPGSILSAAMAVSASTVPTSIYVIACVRRILAVDVSYLLLRLGRLTLPVVAMAAAGTIMPRLVGTSNLGSLVGILLSLAVYVLAVVPSVGSVRLSSYLGGVTGVKRRDRL